MMARDDKDNPASEDDWEQFVDRDDAGFDDAVSDRDDDSAPPLSGIGDAAPDPGYAAFSEEFEDPLADWPGPDSRSPDAAGAEPGSDRPPDGAMAPGYDRGVRGGESKAPAPPQSSATIPGPAFEDDDSPTTGKAEGVEQSDSDDAPPWVEDFTADDEHPDATAVRDWDEPDDFSAPGNEDEVPDAEVPSLPERLLAEELEQLEEQPVTGAEADDLDDEDEFVDEFLNDLDPPELEDELSPIMDDEPLEREERPETGTLKAAGLGSFDEADDEAGDPIDRAVEASRQRFGRGSAAGDVGEEKSRALPVAMIVVVLLALLLLAIGGYGVVEQRRDLQAQIRELQARLATAVTPEQSEAARQARETLAQQAQALEAEMQGLEAENRELEGRVGELETALAEQQALAQAQAEEAAAAAAAAARAAAAAKATPKPTAAAAAAGNWFVNFGSYAQREVASRWAERLRVSEGSVVVQTAEAGGRTVYRVRVAGLQNRDTAERIATVLEKEYKLPRLWVGRN
jgi:cell division septation protein DedD